MEDQRPFFKNMLKSTFKTKVGNPEEISSPVVSAIEENTRAIKDKEVAKQISKPIVTALVDVMEKIEKRKDADESEMNSLLERVKMLKGDQGESADEDFIISAVVPQVLEKVGEVIKPLIPEPIPGEDGKDGDDYILTEKDKKEIAKSIKVPIVERVIEHTVETVIEKTPIVTNEIKEVAVADKAEVLKEKLESLEGDDRLDAKAIKNLPKASFGGGGGIKRIDGALDTRIISPTNGQTLVWNSTRQVWENSAGGSGSGHVIQDEGTPLTARANLNFVGANVNVTDDAGNDATVVTISGGSGSPGGADTQVQFNDGGAFGGISTLTYDKVGDSLLGAVTGDMSIFGQTSASLGIGADDSRIEFTGSTVDFYVDADNAFNLVEYTAGKKAIVDVSLIATTDKTFTLPNSTGTFALLEAGQAFTADIRVPDEAYGAGWNGSLEVPTKNALYDKIETLGGGSGITRTVTVTSGSFTAGSTASTDYVYLIAGAHAVALPTAVGNSNRYTFKNNHSAAITITPAGAETVEGAATIQVAPEDSVDLISNNTSNWNVI